jgi:succinate dehydrogenase hydrophobic membrane anchor protein
MKQLTQGVSDWWGQRLSAAMIVPGMVWLIWAMMQHPSFHQWSYWAHQFWIKSIVLIGWLGVLWHMRLGLWVVLTDYTPPVTHWFLTYMLNFTVITYALLGGYIALFG